MRWSITVLSCLVYLAPAQGQLLGPQEHPSLLYTEADISLLQERIQREPYASWWQILLDRAASPLKADANDRAKARLAKTLAFVYAMGGGDESHARVATQLLLEVVFPPRGGNMGEPHLEGDVVALYATAYDMLHPFLVADPEALAEIRGILAEEAHRLYRGIKVDLGILEYRLHDTPHLDNWHLRVYGGLGLAAWALSGHEGYGGSGPADWAGRAFEVVTRTLDYQIEGEDGGFAEGPFYARYAADLYLPYLLALRRISGIDLFADPKVRRLHRWMVNLRLPNGRRPNIEDGHIDDFYGHYLAAVDALGGVHRWDWEHNESGLYVREFAEMDAIAFYDDQISARPPDWGPTVFMPGAGDAVMRSDWTEDATYMLLRGEHGRVRAHGLGHEHPDETSFILYAGGEMLAVDAGYINFPNHHKVNSGRNHNLVLVNGEGPPLFKIGDLAIGGGNDAFLQRFYTSNFMDYAEVAAEYQDTDVRRRVMFIGKRYFAVADELSSVGENHFEWRLHGNGGGTSGGTYQRDGGLARWTRPGAELLAYLPERTGRVFAERDTLHSFGYREELTHTTLRVMEEGPAAEFLAVLFPRLLDGLEPRISTLVASGGQAVLLEVGNDRDYIWMRQMDAPSIAFDAGGGLTASDARFGLLRLREGQVAALAMHGGRSMTWGGHNLVEAERDVDINLSVEGNSAVGFLRGDEGGFQCALTVGRSVLAMQFDGQEVAIRDGSADFRGAGPLSLDLGPVQPRETAVAGADIEPHQFTLGPNWPNPFNSSTHFRYEVPAAGPVRLDIYNLLGQRVRHLVAGHRSAGFHRAYWDGRDENGRAVATGLYLARLDAGSRWAVRKVIALR